MKKDLKITGHVLMFQTDIKTGTLVPGTVKEDHNAITDTLKAYLAQKIGDDSVNYAIDNLFSSATPADGQDGIAHGDPSTYDVDNAFVTTKNAGGDGSETYIEFYGYIDGAVTLNQSLLLGHNYQAATYNFEKVFATYDINETVDSGRRYHFYWKITIS